MPVNLTSPVAAQLLPVAGVSLGIAEANIKRPDRKDLLVMQLYDGARVAGVFTKNRFCAAPVIVAREHLAKRDGIRALLVNTGNANAGTGEQGMCDARTTCAALAGLLNCKASQILPISRQVTIDGTTITITGIAKGSGMIHPNMATMLGYIATDAAIAQPLLQAMVSEAAYCSFNCITVDGDTSTNDALMLIATGQTDLPEIYDGS